LTNAEFMISSWLVEPSDDLQYSCLHTSLTLREECWIKFFMQLMTVICLD